MIVHEDPGLSWEIVEENWGKLANVESARWIKTYFNRYEGVRYCLWHAYDERQLNNIFTELNIPWKSILEVEETSPDLWGKEWEEHLAIDKKADTLAF